MKNKTRFTVTLSALAIAFPRANAGNIRNVILCIGDGMGYEQIRAASLYLGRPLIFGEFPHTSEMATDMASPMVTDSAAAGTASATGTKVYSGVLSVAMPGDRSPLETVLEFFQKKQKRVGLVSNCSMTDATPAAFASHQSSRSNRSGIAADFLNLTRPNVLFGGGGAGLTVGAAQAAGYAVVVDKHGLAALQPGQYSHVSGQFGSGNMPYAYDGLGDLPELADMTRTALSLLHNPDGFFLMVEGGMIDQACHANDLPRAVAEVLAFERAVAEVMAWAATRSDTLVVVTADHETGGLEVLADAGPGILPEASWTSWDHTAAPVPVFAWGANADLVDLVRDNIDIHLLLKSYFLPPEVCLGLSVGADHLPKLVWTTSAGNTYRLESSAHIGAGAWREECVFVAESNRLEYPFTADGESSRVFRLVNLGD